MHSSGSPNADKLQLASFWNTHRCISVRTQLYAAIGSSEKGLMSSIHKAGRNQSPFFTSVSQFAKMSVFENI